MASIQVPDILWNASGFVLSGIIGATIVVIINHFKQYTSVSLEKIDKQLAFITKTQDSCDELFKKLGKSCPTKIGNIVAL